jgi:hypothetical protein
MQAIWSSGCALSDALAVKTNQVEVKRFVEGINAAPQPQMTPMALASVRRSSSMRCYELITTVAITTLLYCSLASLFGSNLVYTIDSYSVYQDCLGSLAHELFVCEDRTRCRARQRGKVNEGLRTTPDNYIY